jgi:BirA family biotin operon repressor/biotin-[acetyl-CoA-carboxylase] ligase
MHLPGAGGQVETPIVDHASCRSTNEEALRLATEGVGVDCWVTAQRQTAGRGRSGRTWSSPPGNLYATRLHYTTAPVRVLPQLALLAGVALHDAIRAAVPSVPPDSLRLKWPNDVLIGTAKVAGILVESTTWRGMSVAAIGVGVNITAAPEVSGRSVTALAMHGGTCDRLQFLAELDHALNAWFGVWSAGAGFLSIRDAWLARAIRRLSAIRVHTNTTAIEGLFDGIDDDGALSVIDSNGTIVRATFGDVELVSSGPPPTAE